MTGVEWLNSKGLNVDRVVKLGGTGENGIGGVFYLVLNDGLKVPVGQVAAVLSMARFYRLVVTNHPLHIALPKMGRDDWNSVAACLIREATAARQADQNAEVDDDQDDPQDQIRDWIYDFVVTACRGVSQTNKQIAEGVSVNGVARTPQGVVFLNLTKLQDFIAGLGGLSSNGIKFRRNELVDRLRREGFNNVQFGYRNGAQIVNLRMWESAPQYYDVVKMPEGFVVA